jgi:putative aldouronate transport system substrate-binding protein
LSSSFINPETGEPINYRLWASTVEYRLSAQTKLQQDWTAATGEISTLDYVLNTDKAIEIPLAQSLIPVITDDISALASRVGDIVKTNSWKMIFAKDDAEYAALYAEMLEKAEGLGMEAVYAWSLENWETAKSIGAKYS